MTKHSYTNEVITVFFDPDVCIHAGACVRGLPAVFDVDEKPWINVNGAPLEQIIKQIKECPSGALSYKLPKDA